MAIDPCQITLEQKERRRFDPSLCALHGEKLGEINKKLDEQGKSLNELGEFLRARNDYIEMRRAYLDERAVKAHAEERAAKRTRQLSWVAMGIAIVGGVLGWFSGRG